MDRETLLKHPYKQASSEPHAKFTDIASFQAWLYFANRRTYTDHSCLGIPPYPHLCLLLYLRSAAQHSLLLTTLLQGPEPLQGRKKKRKEPIRDEKYLLVTAVSDLVTLKGDTLQAWHNQ